MLIEFGRKGTAFFANNRVFWLLFLIYIRNTVYRRCKFCNYAVWRNTKKYKKYNPSFVAEIFMSKFVIKITEISTLASSSQLKGVL